MRARGWLSAVVAVVLMVGLVLPAMAAKPTMSAVGSVWFFIPPRPVIAPNGYDLHLVFSVRSYDDGSAAGNASVRLFDGASGKLSAVLTAVRQGPGGVHVWDAYPDGDGVRFWVQFELKEGSVHPLLLMPWSWWVSDGGHVDEVMFHGMGPFEVLRGNVTVHWF